MDTNSFSGIQPLLTTEQAAQLLNIKPRTLVVWRHEGRSELRFVRIGRSIRYRVADLQEFIDQQTRSQVA